MLLPQLAELEHDGHAMPTDFHKFYEGSGIVRCRRGGWGYTLINQSPTFLFFQNGAFCLNLRIGASFCEHRNFVPATLAAQAGGVVVRDGTLLASKGRDAIQAGPCFAAHSYTASKEGSLGRVEGCFTAYLTDYSTFEHTISLRALPSRYD